MGDIKISFVIPCYNSINFLKECICSISNQNVAFPIEINCVDDGSTDGTRECIEELQKEIPYLNLYVNEKNSGVSFSRNRAVELSRGKYIWFVDSDDLIAPKAIEHFYSQAEKNNADLIVGRYIKFFEEDSEPAIKSCEAFIENEEATVLVGENLATCPLHEYETTAFVMPLMTKKDFVLKNNLKFNPNISYGEDQIYHIELECIDKLVVRTNFPVYLYRTNKFSVTNRRSSKRCMKSYLSLKELHKGYANILNNNLHPDKKKMQRLTLQMQKSMISALCGTTDSKFVKSELKILKANKLYPYKDVSSKPSFKTKLKKLELYSTLFFYLRHYLHKFYYKIIGLDKKEKSIKHRD